MRKLEKIEFLTPDLTQKGQAVMVASREDLAAFRKGIQNVAGIEDQSAKPLDEKELLDILAEYRTLTEKQNFTTPSQLDQWQKKAN